MIALDKEGWILVGFAMLFSAAIIVSITGWILIWRTRRPKDAPIAPEEETAPLLPPANPLR